MLPTRTMDAPSFKQRFLPLNQRLFGIAFRLLGNAAEAEDMVQNLYLKLWEHRSLMESIENDEAYCTTLLKNMCCDYYRSARVRMVSYDEPPEQPDESPPPYEQSEDCRQIEQLIEQLPPPQQLVIRMRMRDCSFEEMQQATGYTAVNVRALLSRGRKKLKELYNSLM